MLQHSRLALLSVVALVLVFSSAAVFMMARRGGGTQRPAKEMFIQVEYMQPPDDFAGMAAEVDAVLIVRIKSATARDIDAPATTRTGYISEVLRILKTPAASILVGDRIEVCQWGGLREVAGEKVDVSIRGFPRLSIGSEYLVFLGTPDNGGCRRVQWGPDGTFLVAAGRVAAAGEVAFRQSWLGRTVDDVIGGVR